MDIHAAWRSKLRTTLPQVRILVTIGLGRRAQFTPLGHEHHPGTWGRVIRCGTHLGCHVDSENGRTYAYWPTIMAWPQVTFGYSPEERRIEAVQAQVRILPDNPLVRKFFKQKNPQNAWGQVDLWIPGLTLEQTITICAGPITDISSDTDNSPVGVTIQDGYDGIPLEVPYGQEYLTNDEFPTIPEQLSGRIHRRFLLNRNLGYLPIYPINASATEYYVCDPILESMPTEVWAGSDKLKSGQFRFRPAYTSVTNQPYTKLVLADRLENLGYAAGSGVWVLGGMGPNTSNPLQFFIDRQPGLQLTTRAQAYLSEIERRKIFDYYTVIERKGKVLEIITDQLIPTSNLVGFFRGGKLDMIRQNEPGRIHHLAVGSQLKDRLPVDPPETPINSVYNAIDVGYRKNYQTNTTFSRYAKLVDYQIGGSLGKFLRKSESLYGRRYLTMDATDLGHESDAERLGVSILMNTAFPHRRWKYVMDYQYGLGLDINDRVLLTDPLIVADSLPCRIVQMEFNPTSINITVQSEDNPGVE